MQRQGAQKRRKELARQEKQRAKEAAKLQRKADKAAGITTPDEEEVVQPIAVTPDPQPTDPS